VSKSVGTCYSGGFFCGRNGGWISWPRHRVILVAHNEPPSPVPELVVTVESVCRGTVKNPVRTNGRRWSAPKPIWPFVPARKSALGRARSGERGILAFSRNRKAMELYQKGIIVDDFAAYAPAEGSFKGDRVGESSIRAWRAAFLVAAEAHFSKLSLQRRKRDSESPRGEAFVAGTCFEGQHDLLPAQFLKRKDPPGIGRPFML